MERAGRARSQGNWRSGSQGAFRYVVRPAVRGRPKPRFQPWSITRDADERRQTRAGRVCTLTAMQSPRRPKAALFRVPQLQDCLDRMGMDSRNSSNFASRKAGVFPETTNCSGSSCALWLAFCCRSARLIDPGSGGVIRICPGNSPGMPGDAYRDLAEAAVDFGIRGRIVADGTAPAVQLHPSVDAASSSTFLRDEDWPVSVARASIACWPRTLTELTGWMDHPD